MSSPGGLVVAVPLAPEGDAFVAAVEWLARHADVAVLVLAETMPGPMPGPAYERILYGARVVELAMPEMPCVASSRRPTMQGGGRALVSRAFWHV